MTAARRRKLAHPPFLMGRPMKVIPFLFAALLATFSLPAFAQTPLKLGLLLDMAGPYADVGGQGTLTATRMAVDDFGGIVLGRPIEVVFADHQNKVDLAGSLARQSFDEQGVETILDVAGSSAALAVNEVAKARNKILVVNASAGGNAMRVSHRGPLAERLAPHSAPSRTSTACSPPSSGPSATPWTP